MAQCPACKRDTLRITPERFDATGQECAVWDCASPDCGYGEGRPTGRATPPGLASDFTPRPSRRPNLDRPGVG